jgi:hypothetical protein
MKVDAYVASTLEEMKWNVQGKDITCRAFHFTGQRSCRECMTRFRIDGHTIKRGKLVCISVILCHLKDLTLHAMLGSSGVVKGVKNPLKNVCENANSRTQVLDHFGVNTFAQGLKK